MINLEHLTEEERKIIMDVLKRDEVMRQSEQERVNKLKTELHDLRRKSAVKVDDEAPASDSKKVCARCREPLGLIFNSGEVCSRCQHKVCTECKVALPNSPKWLCTVCHKLLQIKLESGDAFGPKVEENRADMYGTELIKVSLQYSKKPTDPTVVVNSSTPRSPADSGFHGHPNISSMGESTEASTAYDDEYASDVSYGHSTASGMESIGPSVSQRGFPQDDSTKTRYDSSTPSSPWLTPDPSRHSSTDLSTPLILETEDRSRGMYKKKQRRGGGAPSSLPGSVTSSPQSALRHKRYHSSGGGGTFPAGLGARSRSGQSSNRSSEITLEKVSPAASRRSHGGDVANSGVALRYDGEAEEAKHRHDNGDDRESNRDRFSEEDARSYRSRGSSRVSYSEQPPIPTIAIQDVGDSRSERSYQNGSSTLLRQAMEADMYRNGEDSEHEMSRSLEEEEKEDGNASFTSRFYLHYAGGEKKINGRRDEVFDDGERLFDPEDAPLTGEEMTLNISFAKLVSPGPHVNGSFDEQFEVIKTDNVQDQDGEAEISSVEDDPIKIRHDHLVSQNLHVNGSLDEQYEVIEADDVQDQNGEAEISSVEDDPIKIRHAHLVSQSPHVNGSLDEQFEVIEAIDVQNQNGEAEISPVKDKAIKICHADLVSQSPHIKGSLDHQDAVNEREENDEVGTRALQAEEETIKVGHDCLVSQIPDANGTVDHKSVLGMEEKVDEEDQERSRALPTEDETVNVCHDTLVSQMPHVSVIVNDKSNVVGMEEKVEDEDVEGTRVLPTGDDTINSYNDILVPQMPEGDKVEVVGEYKEENVNHAQLTDFLESLDDQFDASMRVEEHVEHIKIEGAEQAESKTLNNGSSLTDLAELMSEQYVITKTIDEKEEQGIEDREIVEEVDVNASCSHLVSQIPDLGKLHDRDAFINVSNEGLAEKDGEDSSKEMAVGDVATDVGLNLSSKKVGVDDSFEDQHAIIQEEEKVEIQNELEVESVAPASLVSKNSDIDMLENHHAVIHVAEELKKQNEKDEEKVIPTKDINLNSCMVTKNLDVDDSLENQQAVVLTDEVAKRPETQEEETGIPAEDVFYTLSYSHLLSSKPDDDDGVSDKEDPLDKTEKGGDDLPCDSIPHDQEDGSDLDKVKLRERTTSSEDGNKMDARYSVIAEHLVRKNLTICLAELRRVEKTLDDELHHPAEAELDEPVATTESDAAIMLSPTTDTDSSLAAEIFAEVDRSIASDELDVSFSDVTTSSAIGSVSMADSPSVKALREVKAANRNSASIEIMTDLTGDDLLEEIKRTPGSFKVANLNRSSSTVEVMTDLTGDDLLGELSKSYGSVKDSNTGESVTYHDGQIITSADADHPMEDEDVTLAPVETPEEPKAELPAASSVDVAAASVDVATDKAHTPPDIPEPKGEIPAVEEAAKTPEVLYNEEEDLDELVQKYKASSQSSKASSPIGRKTSKKGMLHKGSSSSLASLYSTGEEFYGKYPITGDVSFGLGYNYKTNVFQVKVGGCRDLVPIDAKKSKSDPYVKTYLLPDKSKHSKRKTKIKRGTINPNYSENLKYSIAQSELETRTLSVAVWHDKFGYNMFLGEVLLPLDSVDVNNYPTKWHQLKTRVPSTETKAISYKGDLVVALMFEVHDENSNANGTGTEAKGSKGRKKKPKHVGGTLKVHVKEAKNLTASRVNGNANPYVKIYLEPDRSKGGKRKTSVMKNTTNPVFEQSFEFANVTVEGVKERALEVGIWDNETIGSASFLGGVRLGSGSGKSHGRSVEWQDSTGIEIQLWEEMMKNHNQWVEACLTLRSSFDRIK